MKEIVVLLEGGLPLFHYSVTGTRKLDELVSGFLSAMGSFAEEVGGTKVKVMSFAKNKFVWEQKGNLLFIALIAEDDSVEIHRVILQDLSSQFVSRYYSELTKEHPDHRVFRAFSDAVELTLQKFDGIPGLARRYKTALFPVEHLRRMKTTLIKLEENPFILRGAAITSDGFIMVSSLRAYELEAALDLLHSINEKPDDKKNSLLVVHTSLEPVTSFYVTSLTSQATCIFVVKTGKNNEDYLEMVKPFLDIVQESNYDLMKRIYPLPSADTMSFYDFDLVIQKMSNEKVKDQASVLFAGLSEERQDQAQAILRSIEGNTLIFDIEEKFGLAKEDLNEALAFLIAKGLIQIAKAFPVMGERDERFAAYLEVIGIPKRDYDVVDSVWEYCNGAFSVKEISEKAGIPASRLVEVLRTLGKNVVWQQDRVMAHVR